MTVPVRVLFLASLREAVGQGELTLEAAHLGDLVGALRGALSAEAFETVTGENIRIARNQTLLAPGIDPAATTLEANDEIAFLPPVTGG